MNYERLKIAEANFLQAYPGGFADPALEPTLKKHRMSKMVEFASELFDPGSFYQPNDFLERLVKLVSRSSMVSIFEKPKFRDAVNDLNSSEREALTAALNHLYHGPQEEGLCEVVDILARQKIAKWSVITIGLVYFKPQEEVFVKPTTAKAIVNKLELDLDYKPRPDWAFYSGYREAIMDIKGRVDPSLSSNNVALTGFLMMTL
jgi:hypothetical protein